jgi:hypothetical protein
VAPNAFAAVKSRQLYPANLKLCLTFNKIEPNVIVTVPVETVHRAEPRRAKKLMSLTSTRRIAVHRAKSGRHIMIDRY